MISTRSDARGATRARDRCERSLDQRRARRWRRLPPRLGLELVDLNPFEQHRQLVDVDRNARYALGDAGRERERPALEALVHDREPAARPQDQLDLVPATIEEHEHVAAERVVAERVADLIGEPLERLPQIRRLGGEVHPHRARQEDHDADLASSHASAATHAGDTPSISITIPWGTRITAAGAAVAAPITAAGAKVNAVLVSGPATRSRFLHQASRCGTRPRDRANASSVLPLRFHSARTPRASASVQCLRRATEEGRFAMPRASLAVKRGAAPPRSYRRQTVGRSRFLVRVAPVQIERLLDAGLEEQRYAGFA